MGKPNLSVAVLLIHSQPKLGCVTDLIAVVQAVAGCGVDAQVGEVLFEGLHN